MRATRRPRGGGQAAAGVVAAATQLGFAAGLVLVVPFGDILPRRPFQGTTSR